MPPARPEAARAAEAPKLGRPAEASDPTKVAATPPPARETPRPAAGVTAGAPYWVQVGAFKDEATAKRLVDKLR
ncbi:MAG TPA: SPOR domain-containing protein, partial [Methylomirabilota bacterium]|nr:SPOR domain-containing protein [Methylomirabilota bacterium]